MIDLASYHSESVLVIAEVGCNHNGEFSIAEKLVDLAAEAGADAVKFQAFRPEHMITRDAPKAEYQLKATGTAETQYDRLERLRLDGEQLATLQARCRDRGVIFCASAFDIPSVDLLVDLGAPLLKVPSGELTNIPLLRHMSMTGLPAIVSTGMANEAEVRQAIDALDGVSQLMLLHCVSAYPSDWSDANLQAIPSLARAFELPVGFSDHSQDVELAVAAVALGAVAVEKHITLDRGMEGGDHLASLEPADFARMVRSIRALGPALGDGLIRCMPSERNVRDIARKSIVTTRRIPKGKRIDAEDLTCKRPGTGMSPARLQELLGLTAIREIAADVLVEESMFADRWEQT